MKHIALLKIPDDTQVFDGELATFWFDDEGILYALSKNTPRSLEKQKKNYDFIREITGNKKVCLLSDTTTGAAQDRETRNYSAQELPNVFNAMAVISNSMMGILITNIFLVLNRQPIPIKFFQTEKEAKEWLRQYK